MSLLAFLNCLCGRQWQAFKGAGLPIQAPRYSFPQDSLSSRPDSRALISVLLTLWHRPRCPKCHRLHTSYCYQPHISVAYHSLTPSLWHFVPAAIHERCCKSFITWAIWAYKLVCLSVITFEKDWETWLPTCDFTWFWGICYSAKPYHPVNSFGAWPPCHGLVSEAFVHGVASVGKRLSTLKAWRIVFP